MKKSTKIYLLCILGLFVIGIPVAGAIGNSTERKIANGEINIVSQDFQTVYNVLKQDNMPDEIIASVVDLFQEKKVMDGTKGSHRINVMYHGNVDLNGNYYPNDLDYDYPNCYGYTIRFVDDYNGEACMLYLNSDEIVALDYMKKTDFNGYQIINLYSK